MHENKSGYIILVAVGLHMKANGLHKPRYLGHPPNGDESKGGSIECPHVDTLATYYLPS